MKLPNLAALPGVSEEDVEKAKAMMQSGVDGAKNLAAGAVTVANRAAVEASSAAKELAVDQIEAQFDKQMAEARVGLADDADMPRFVARSMQSLFDKIAPDVKIEFLELVERALGVAHKVAPPLKLPPEALGCCDCLGAAKRCAAGARAAVLYALYPYDKSVWAKLRSPLFLLLTLLKCVPVAGASQIAFAALLCVIDRTDEAQLVQFVLGFKGFQFVTTGILPGLVGVVLYVRDLTLPGGGGDDDADDDGATHACDRSGPAADGLSSLTFYVDAAGFVLQCALVWLAMYLLRSALPKGGSVSRKGQLVGQGGARSGSGGEPRCFGARARAKTPRARAFDARARARAPHRAQITVLDDAAAGARGGGARA